MSKSYSKIRHIQESNNILERRFINEQVDETTLNTSILTSLNKFATILNNMLVEKKITGKFLFKLIPYKDTIGIDSVKFVAHYNDAPPNSDEGAAEITSKAINHNGGFNPKAGDYIKGLLLTPIMKKYNTLIKGRGDYSCNTNASFCDTVINNIKSAFPSAPSQG